MANSEHLARLLQGAESWNRWRGHTRDISQDISRAQLPRVDLSGADLLEADLTAADLTDADLTKAMLARANLRKANLSGANLSQAHLNGADLSRANCEAANFARADLSTADLTRANFRRAILNWANVSRAMLHMADFSGADMSGANLHEARLSKASFHAANLTQALLTRTYLLETDLSEANLSQADLLFATIIESNLERANLTHCRVYGISAWDVRLEGAIQSNLVITPFSAETAIQVDNLEVAQFIYLLLNNEKIRNVIGTITSKVVLILGRFTQERKLILEAIREELRKHDYLPVLFDFEKPSSRDTTETVRTLAHMARFVIADITDAKSIPQELIAIVPNLPSVPVQPLLLASQHEYSMFEHLRRFPWVLEPVLYENQASLLMELEQKVIAPAEAKANQQMRN